MTLETSQSQETHMPPLLPLSDRLRADTRTTHEGVDQAIMAGDPFKNIEKYGLYLQIQYGLHRDVEPLYTSSALIGAQGDFPVIKDRGRLDAVIQDAADLGVTLSRYATPPLSENIDLAQALGWLYVVEGSNLGAAFLLKYAKQIGLSETHGARHLAEPPEGRAPYWRTFKDALNGVTLGADDDARACEAARTAFNRVRALVRCHFDEASQGERGA